MISLQKITPTPQITLVIWAAIITAAITIIAIVTTTILVPGNASIVTTIIGITSPIILMLIGIGLQGVHQLVNSNLQEVKDSLIQVREQNNQLRDRAVLVAESSQPILSPSLLDSNTLPSVTVAAPTLIIPKITDKGIK